MASELTYTSVPKGLHSGTSGFCTVAQSRQISPGLVPLLESLSGYEEIFAPTDPNAASNPVSYSHYRFTVEGETRHVLSRVCFAGLDYTGRFNKLAHHVALNAHERTAGGPAALQSTDRFHTELWDETPAYREHAKELVDSGGELRRATNWEIVAGDAGWAGALAQSLVDGREAVILYDPLRTTGTQLLAMLSESTALLPMATRWRATYCTYFTSLPNGSDCIWRCAVKGTDIAAELLESERWVIDLTDTLGGAPAGELITAARTGQREVEAPLHLETPAVVVEQSDWEDDFDDIDEDDDRELLKPNPMNLGGKKVAPSKKRRAASKGASKTANTRQSRRSSTASPRDREPAAPKKKPLKLLGAALILILLTVVLTVSIKKWEQSRRVKAASTEGEAVQSHQPEANKPAPEDSPAAATAPPQPKEEGRDNSASSAVDVANSPSEPHTVKQSPSTANTPITPAPSQEPLIEKGQWSDGVRFFHFDWPNEFGSLKKYQVRVPKELEGKELTLSLASSKDKERQLTVTVDHFDLGSERNKSIEVARIKAVEGAIVFTLINSAVTDSKAVICISAAGASEYFILRKKPKLNWEEVQRTKRGIEIRQEPAGSWLNQAEISNNLPLNNGKSIPIDNGNLDLHIKWIPKDHTKAKLSITERWVSAQNTVLRNYTRANKNEKNVRIENIKNKINLLAIDLYPEGQGLKHNSGRMYLHFHILHHIYAKDKSIDLRPEMNKVKGEAGVKEDQVMLDEFNRLFKEKDISERLEKAREWITKEMNSQGIDFTFTLKQDK